MKKLTTILTAFLLLTGVLLADEKAIDAARDHLCAVLGTDLKKLEISYAADVVLMPGHEFLKPEYGLTDVPGRSKATQVKREKLIEAMGNVAAKQPVRPADKIAAVMESLKFEVLKATEGEFAAPPDLKRQFTIQKGDVLLKASLPKGDFILLQLRQIEESWKVVAEYLD